MENDNIDDLERAVEELESQLLRFVEDHETLRRFARTACNAADCIKFDPEGKAFVNKEDSDVLAEFVDEAAGLRYERDSDPFRKREFEELKEKWKKETGYVSSVTDMCMNEHYQRIIGMGRAALPHIFRDLKEDEDGDEWEVGGHWHWALKAITGYDPVPEEHEGDMDAIARDWLECARETGWIDS